MRWFAIATAVCAVLASARAGAEDRVLTLQEALQLAEGSGPALRLARARVEEERGRRTGAALLLHDNPTASATGGARVKPSRVQPEVDVALSQTFETGGQRGARLAMADGDVASAEAVSANVERILRRDVAAAFLRAVHAAARAALAQRTAASLQETAAQLAHRAEAGDIAPLDANLAASAAARARADVGGAAAAQSAALGALQLELGLDPAAGLAVAGTLDLPPTPQHAELEAAGHTRADLKALRAALRAAQAAAGLAEALAWPDVGAGVGYSFDDGDHIAQASMSFTIPVFQNGTAERAEARARAARLNLELEAAETAARTELATALSIFAARASAADELATHALPLLDENVRLATRAHAAGEIRLTELLAVMREAAATRAEHIDLLLDLALARIDVTFAAGVRE